MSLSDGEERKQEAVFFFDFDNTITSFDVFDDIIQKFSVDDGWVALEEEWQAGRIGSRQCLAGQLQSVRASEGILSAYLSTIKVDPAFKKLLSFLSKKNIEAIIVSDSFSFFINEILASNDISIEKVYSNELEFQGDRLIPSFPYMNNKCPDCAHCKTKHFSENEDKKIIYAGDGRSDFCAALEADVVYAKGTLLRYLTEQGKPCIPFSDFEDIYLHAAKMFSGASGIKGVLQVA